MVERHTDTLVQQLRRLLEPQAARDLADAELLRLFAGERDEQAFAALVHRHGRMVWAVCRHVLQHEQDAEDAFQGTFLVLARKAGAIRKKKSVASWLYGVAYRVAHKARVAAARRRRHEQRAAGTILVNAAVEPAWRELQAILDEELCRLPEKWRAPFVLCCLNGQTKKEAAQTLGWKEGTVSSRLAHARKRLQQRLERRGVSLSAVLCGMALAENASAAALPPALAAMAIKASLAFAAGQVGAGASGGAGELARAVLQAMAATRIKIATVVLLLISVAGVGVTLGFREPAAARRALARTDDVRDPQLRRNVAARIAVPTSRLSDRPGTMTVSGRVTGQDGRPVAGAQVAMIAGEFRKSGRKVLRSGQTDAQGRFLLSLARPAAGRDYGVSLITASPGHAPNWYTVSPRQEHHDIACELEPGQVVRGRLVDEQGAPAGGVKVHVVGLVKRKSGASVMRFRDPPEKLAAWPEPATTDGSGDFLIRDVPSNGELDLQIHDERFAPQWLVLRTGPKERPESNTFKLAARRTIEGTVTCADTGLPMPQARLAVMSFGPGASAGLVSKSEARADAQGRFRLTPFPGEELVITATPPARTTYLGLHKSVKLTANTRHSEVNLALPRGVLVHGRVVEGPSEVPVEGAKIEYRPRFNDNPYVRAEDPAIEWSAQDARSGPDGAFQLPVVAGPGWLLVQGPSADFIHVEISDAQIQGAKAGGTPYFPDAVIPLEPRPGVGTLEVRAGLRRGVTVSGQVLGHDALPAPAAFLMAPTFVPYEFSFRGEVLAARDGRFELPGCDPDKSVPVLFFDTKRQEGAVVEISAKESAPLVVRLAPCGSAATRFVDSSGRALVKPPMQLDVLLRPGTTIQESFDGQVPACLTVPAGRIFGPQCVSLDPKTGAATFTCLIPGATYLVHADEGAGIVRKAQFTVQPGARTKLPDIVLKPTIRPER